MKQILQIFLPIILLCLSSESFAKQKPISKKSVKVKEIKRVQTSLVVDADSGKVLHNVNGAHRIYPASLTKLMSLYMAFDAIRSGKISMDSKLKVSRKAESMIPLKLGLKAGETITAREAILGMIIRSANDASVVIAEALGKNEEDFAKAMTQKAHQLGMKSSNFYNASGLHHPEQKTTASDLARLTLAIKRDFPEYYSWFSKTEFTYNGRLVKGHNRVVQNYAGAEGMKTGYTIPAGFNLITTAKRDGKRLVAVVTGSPAVAARDAKMIKLLDNHFSSLDKNASIFEVQGNNYTKQSSKITRAKSQKTNRSKPAKTLRI